MPPTHSGERASWRAISEGEIRELVSEGLITDRVANQHLVEVLLRRQRKILAYWLTRTNPLDDFELRRGESGTELRFGNAAIRHGVADSAAKYRYRWFRLDNRGGERVAADAEDAVQGDDRERIAVPVPKRIWGPRDVFGFRYALVEIETDHTAYRHWMKPVTVTLRNRRGIEIVGVRRPREMPEDEPISEAAPPRAR